MALNIGPWIVAVDPGTLSLGVCLSTPTGEIVRTWSLTEKGLLDVRLLGLARKIAHTFAVIESIAMPEPYSPSFPGIDLTIEDGIYRARPKVCSMLGEVRGLVMGEAFRRGWTVRRMVPLAWKNTLTKPERLMKKDQKYVTYWNGRLGLGLRTPDEVDAVHIARKAVAGRR